MLSDIEGRGDRKIADGKQFYNHLNNLKSKLKIKLDDREYYKILEDIFSLIRWLYYTDFYRYHEEPYETNEEWNGIGYRNDNGSITYSDYIGDNILESTLVKEVKGLFNKAKDKDIYLGKTSDYQLSRGVRDTVVLNKCQKLFPELKILSFPYLISFVLNQLNDTEGDIQQKDYYLIDDYVNEIHGRVKELYCEASVGKIEQESESLDDKKTKKRQQLSSNNIIELIDNAKGIGELQDIINKKEELNQMRAGQLRSMLVNEFDVDEDTSEDMRKSDIVNFIITKYLEEGKIEGITKEKLINIIVDNTSIESTSKKEKYKVDTWREKDKGLESEKSILLRDVKLNVLCDGDASIINKKKEINDEYSEVENRKYRSEKIEASKKDAGVSIKKSFKRLRRKGGQRTLKKLKVKKGGGQRTLKKLKVKKGVVSGPLKN